MSYDIYLKEPNTGAVIEFDGPHRIKGGTHAVGGTAEAGTMVLDEDGLIHVVASLARSGPLQPELRAE